MRVNKTALLRKGVHAIDIYLLLMLFLTSSFYFRLLNGTVRMIIVYIIIAITALTPKINKNNSSSFIGQLLFVLMIVLLILNSLINMVDIKNSLIPIAILVSAYCLAHSISFLEFTESYVRVMVFIAVTSLLTYLLASFLPGLIRAFPLLTESQTNTAGERYAYFLIVSFIKLNMPIRNYGIFWEGGAYTAFLSIAFIFELLVSEKPRKKILVLFLVTLVSTLSTIGLLSALILSVLGALILTETQKKHIYVFRGIIIISIIAGLFYMVYPLLPESIQYVVLGKIQKFFMYGSTMETINTQTVRYDSIYAPMALFLENPIIGAGKDAFIGLRTGLGHGMLTCTPVNILAKYGVLYFLIMVFGIRGFLNRIDERILVRSLVLFDLILIVSTQAYEENIVILALVFYGLMSMNTPKSNRAAVYRAVGTE